MPSSGKRSPGRPPQRRDCFLTRRDRILAIINLVFLVKACLADDGHTTHGHQAELGQVHGKVEPQAAVYPVSSPAPAAQYGQPAPYGQQQAPYGQPQQAYGQQQQPYPSQ